MRRNLLREGDQLENKETAKNNMIEVVLNIDSTVTVLQICLLCNILLRAMILNVT